METSILAQTALNGLVLSSTYILVALGISCIFSMLRLITFAHGEMYMIGSYLAYLFIVQMGLNYGIAVVFVILMLFLLGMLLQWALWKPLIDKPHAYPLIMSLGLALFLQSVALLVFGERHKAIPTVFKGVFTIGNVHISWERFAALAGSIIILAIVVFFFRTNKFGQAMRAISLDPEVSKLQGIGVERLQMLGFGIGCAVAAAEGALMAPLFAIYPTMGLEPICKAFIVMTLGGIGNIFGVIPAGFIIGFIESFGLTYVGKWANMFGYLIFVLVLLLRPKGLMGYEA